MRNISRDGIPGCLSMENLVRHVERQMAVDSDLVHPIGTSPHNRILVCRRLSEGSPVHVSNPAEGKAKAKVKHNVFSFPSCSSGK
ncbi:hypothetical protein FOZ63_030636 [Perkinsus olseni]|uniref:Uncharacterized protein n=1 Tax=Perkinsus olseni TaxID=32597 RepID=A0A7J6RP41_PEROL|nr:hypothetical protein FOZ63_030636 [Perkinsus olseni]